MEYYGFLCYWHSVSGDFFLKLYHWKLFLKKKKWGKKDLIKFLFIYFTHLHRIIAMFPSLGKKFDLRTLRAIRVLRPLKLVSGIPSMYQNDCDHKIFEFLNRANYFEAKYIFFPFFFGRSASGFIFNIESNGAASTNRFTGFVCNCDFCYYRFRILFGSDASNLL